MTDQNKKTIKVINKVAPTGFVFFLAYVGAAIYFIHKTSGGFWEVILGLLQAIIWPVYVMYHVLQMIHA